jgi:hypothetical protein
LSICEWSAMVLCSNSIMGDVSGEYSKIKRRKI